MDDIFHNLLVGCPNDGGLIFIRDGEYCVLDGSNTTGMHVHEGRVYRGVQPDEVWFSKGLAMHGSESRYGDVHDVFYLSGFFYVVSTQDNSISKLCLDGAEVQRWKFPGEEDSWHINCVGTARGRIVFSAFGDFRKNREYKGKTRGAGFVQDLESGERLITDLSQPHSILETPTGLLVANSELCEIVEYDAEFGCVRRKNLGGYVRGIHASEGRLFVGLSKSRNIEDSGVPGGTVLALDSATWSELGRFHLPANEIYSIQHVTDDQACSVLAGVAQASWSRLRAECFALDELEKKAREDGYREQQEYLRASREEAEATATAEKALRDDLLGQISAMRLDRSDVLRRLEKAEGELSRSLDREAFLQQERADLAKVFSESVARIESEKTERVVSLMESASKAESEVESLKSEVAVLQEKLMFSERQSADASAEASRSIDRLVEEKSRADHDLKEIRQSEFWRVTAPARWGVARFKELVRASVRPLKALAFFTRAHDFRRAAIAQARREGAVLTLKRAARFLARGGMRELIASPPPKFSLRMSNGQPVVILTTRHCLYLADAMKANLLRVGITAEIIFERPSNGYSDVPHFVICPQIFETLPDFYVAYQLEQSVSSRWFTDHYLRVLESSFAILDYSLLNIEYLSKRGISNRQMYYCPVGGIEGYGDEEKAEYPEFDVLFYGDINCERRKNYLEKLSERFSVRVVSDLFGKDLRKEMSKAKVIVNIHYYPGALLETTRIWECISLGHLVVSERSSDMHEHPELERMVSFVDVDDIDGMIGAVSRLIEDDEGRRQMAISNIDSLASDFNKFDYYFLRFLLATDNITFDQFWDNSGKNLVLGASNVCLNLPEYPERKKSFESNSVHGFWVFPGLRHSQGWIGCALSYKYIMKLALQQDMDQIVVCEDDVEFDNDFDANWSLVKKRLVSGGWDVFSGLMADVHPQLKVTSVEVHDGLTYVGTDRMISTVFNVYNKRVFNLMSQWDEDNRDVNTNTIDRYLEGSGGIKVLATVPFLVGHKEELHSTIWNFQNTQYRDLISKSEASLRERAKKFASNECAAAV